LPSLPDWGEEEHRPLDKPLLAPVAVRSWWEGNNRSDWGRPVSYPKGTSQVRLSLVEFLFSSEHMETGVQEIYRASSPWRRLFEQYVTLQTKQGTKNPVSGGDWPGRLMLYTEDARRGRPTALSRETPTRFVITVSGEDVALNRNQLTEAARLASDGLAPQLQYLMLLEAYGARRNSDYRKAIIDAAIALEICLTQSILEEYSRQGITSGEKELDKFRTLGQRLQLLRRVGISIPSKDYEQLVVNPRNDVIHRGVFPDPSLANRVIAEVENLLYLLTPQLHERP